MKWFMLMLSPLLLVTVVASSWAVGPVSTNTQTQPMLQCRQRFESMDTNHDGKVSKEEFMAAYQCPAAKPAFESIAKGKNYITQDEFCANKGRQGYGHGGTGKNGKQ